MQNFSEGPHRATIRDERAIYSAAGNGRVPFIGADDIALAAAAGTEDRVAPDLQQLTGATPITFATFVAQNSRHWRTI